MSRQIQLICYYDYIRDPVLRTSLSASQNINASASFGSYIARILGDGNRMDVDLRRHTSKQASSGLIYDQSFNVIYLSTYNTTSYSGRKKVVKIRLSPSYNFRSELSSTNKTEFLPLAMQDTQFVLPGPANLAPSTYPLGLSLENAYIKPYSNSLFLYTPTMEAPGMLVNKLYYIPATGGPVGERAPLIIDVESSSSRCKCVHACSIAFKVLFFKVNKCLGISCGFYCIQKFVIDVKSSSLRCKYVHKCSIASRGGP